MGRGGKDKASIIAGILLFVCMVIVFLIHLTGPAAAQTRQFVPQFGDYPVEWIYRGKVAAPILD
jgi:hypothetical protein